MLTLTASYVRVLLAIVRFVNLVTSYRMEGVLNVLLDVLTVRVLLFAQLVTITISIVTIHNAKFAVVLWLAKHVMELAHVVVVPMDTTWPMVVALPVNLIANSVSTTPSVLFLLLMMPFHFLKLVLESTP